MNIVDVLPIRLGQTASVVISKQEDLLYRFLSRIHTGGNFEFATDTHFNTVPVSNDQIDKEPDSLGYYITSRLCKNHSVTHVIIDILSPNDEFYRGHILFTITKAIKIQCNDFDKRSFILITPEIPDDVKSDDSFEPILDLIESGKVIVIDHDGKTTLDGFFTAERYSEFVTLVSLAENDLLSLIGIKLIKRLGHFKHSKPNGEYDCARYFYDCSLCVRELTEYLFNYYKRILTNDNQVCLMYHSPQSPWLNDALSSTAELLSSKLSLRVKVLNLDEETETSIESHKDADCVVIFDLIDTGSTSKRVIDKLNKCHIIYRDVLAILATQSSDDVRKNIALTETINVNYVLKVEQHKLPSHSCLKCKAGQEFNDCTSESEYLSINSYDFWQTAIESGIVAEDPVPEFRRDKPQIPTINFKSIIDNHGAWLAYKIKLRLNSISVPSDCIVICPDEPNSIAFTSKLQYILELSVLRIPRDVINTFIEPNDNLEKYVTDLKKDGHIWLSSLRSYISKDIIIIDEFNLSGKTLLGMTNMLAHFSKNVRCIILFNNLAPDTIQNLGTEVFSLYMWQRFIKRNRDTDGQ